jgi:hypothetical protein
MTIFNLTKPLDDFIPDHKRNAVTKGPRRPNSKFKGEISRPAEVWRPEYIATIRYCAAMGATEAELAMCLGIRVSVLQKWVRERYDVQRALAAGTCQANLNVRAALYQRATGYEHPEVKVFYDSDRGACVEHEVTKHYPPDVKAAEVWLRNRDSLPWESDVQPPSNDFNFTINIGNSAAAPARNGQTIDLHPTVALPQAD